MAKFAPANVTISCNGKPTVPGEAEDSFLGEATMEYRENPVCPTTILHFFKDCLYKQGWVYCAGTNRFELKYGGEVYYVEFGKTEKEFENDS